MPDFDAMIERYNGLLQKLEPRARSALARDMVTRLRASQIRRIASQRNPDGSAYVRRKPVIRRKIGLIKKGPMFTKLGTARYLKTRASAHSAIVEFSGTVQRIARVHQFGLKEVIRNLGVPGPSYQYPERELLGFSDEDVEMLETLILDHLSG